MADLDLTRNGARRIGAIDVGTNSIRLIVAEAAPDGSYRILDDEKETTRLGAGLAQTGQIDAHIMERAAQAIGRMKSIAEGFNVEKLKVIGTCAVREAVNGKDFLAMVRERTGVAIEPISSDEEAHFAYVSVANAFDLREKTVAVADIGGGSTEIVLTSGGAVEQVYSLPLGAVRLTDQFGGPELASSSKFRKMWRTIRTRLRKTLGRLPFQPQVLIGTGGTFTSLANISLQRHRSDGHAALPTVRGYELRRPEVRHLMEWLRKMPLRARARVPGLSPDRADIIVAGAAIVDRVMKYLGVNRLLIHDGGVRDGLLRSMTRSLFPSSTPDVVEPPRPMQSVRQFATSCGYEERHCTHVAELAGQVFDQLAQHYPTPPGGWSDPSRRMLLEAAALLKDVGYMVSYSRHHQHTYHLILHSDLAGLTPQEIELVANIARYHRRARPKKKHLNFRALTKPERSIVRHLAAILRIADGLDRNRLGNVHRVRIQMINGDVHFILDAAENPSVEIWGALSKSNLFKRVFKKKPQFEWAQQTQLTSRK